MARVCAHGIAGESLCHAGRDFCGRNREFDDMRCTLLILLFCAGAWAQSARQEIGLTLGRIGGAEHAQVNLGTGTALQANYGLRLGGGERVALFGEVHFLANPQRVVTSANRAATRDVATLYVTPGVRVKFFPSGRVQPFAAVGGGYALYEHSLLNQGGTPNAAPRTASTGALMFGGGVDVALVRWLGLRVEVRDFVTGTPRYSVAVDGRQHNVVTSGGLVLRF
jgi:hypothetical protein